MTDLPMLPCQERVLAFIEGENLGIEGINRDSIARDIALVEKITAKGDTFWPPRLGAAHIKLLLGEEQDIFLQRACERVLALAAGTFSEEEVSTDELANAIDVVGFQEGGVYWEYRIAEAEFELTVMREAEAARAEREEILERKRLVDAILDERERVSDFVSEKPEITPANLATDIRALEAVMWFDRDVAAIVAAAKRIILERREAREQAERDAWLERANVALARDRAKCAPLLERLKKFVSGSLPSTVATSTIATDLDAVKRCYGGDFSLQQLIADVGLALYKRRAADKAALDDVRRQARERYERNRRNRAEENRARAKEMGSARKQK